MSSTDKIHRVRFSAQEGESVLREAVIKVLLDSEAVTPEEAAALQSAQVASRRLKDGGMSIALDPPYTDLIAP